ncbi:thioesterase family protein-like protein [Delitschia confertaspora ATCC 74209]|uniref:Thioesterase family protein-like protein n=1 Tax=Delitschia confertaspora ATCC 74209 TaxID=1513339 RepID=A0A9P4JWD5_9PLEO|nr:thioesterase family protein-like protein [Delitschia confertaspora ATCC 74209]
MASLDKGKAKAMRAVQAMFDRYHLLSAQRPPHHKDFDHQVMANLKLIDVTPEGTATFEMVMSEGYSNLNEVMHGGAAALIFDMATTSALCPLARPGYWEFMGGVTRTLNISYIKPVPIGTTVRIVSKAVAVGKQMAMIRGKMVSVDGKTTYCTVEHHKVNTPVRSEHRKARLPWDDEFEKEHGVKRERGESKL